MAERYGAKANLGCSADGTQLAIFHTLVGLNTQDQMPFSTPLQEKTEFDEEHVSRCSMVCPVGVDIAFLIRKVKEGWSATGFSPQDLVAAGERAERIGSLMGVTEHALKETIRVQLFKVLSRSSFMSRIA